MDGNLWLLLSGWLYLGLVAGLVVLIVVRKREPSAALAWSLAIIFLPGLGPVLFLLAGWNRVARRLLRKRGHREVFLSRFPLADDREPVLGSFDAGHPAGRWGRVSRMLASLGECDRTRGNATTLYHNGRLAFDEMVHAIERARHHVHVEFYILCDDELGRQLVDVLAAKARAGVEVRFLVDAIGSWHGFKVLRRLQKAGGEAATFLPLTSIGRASPNLRNHRKIVVCDGECAFFGGMNVGAEYLGKLGRKTRGRDWYDLHMKICGPAVLALQLVFVEDWDFATGRLLESAAYFPPPAERGSETAQVVAGGPDSTPNPIRQAYLAAIQLAQREIVIATPYLIPDLALRDTLMVAARSGVDVHIVTQSWPPDGYVAYFCGQFYTEELLEAGVRVHVYDPGMMHAKAIAVDGEWAMLGTANLDNRSMFLNFELMTVFDGATAGEITAELRRLVGEAREVTAGDMARRGRWQRALASTARLFAPLL